MIIAALGIIAGAFLLARWPRPPRKLALVPAISVIIPARNEASRLPRLLDSLNAGRVRPAEVLVVDDESTDGTAALARTRGARVITPGPVPPGWVGKTWACAAGAGAAAHSQLLFLDADAWFASEGLQALAALGEQYPGAISLQPYHVTETISEQLSAFFNLVQLMATGGFAACGRRDRAGFFGASLWIDAKSYRLVGGHAAVRGEILENVVLARRLQQAGIATWAFSGKEILRFRMYVGGMCEVAAGWRKAFARGASAARLGILLPIILWITGACDAALRLSIHLAQGTFAAQIVVPYVIYVLEITWFLRLAGRFQRWTALAYPIPLAFFLAVFAQSLSNQIRHRPASWRGRTVTRSAPSTVEV